MKSECGLVVIAWRNKQVVGCQFIIWNSNYGYKKKEIDKQETSSIKPKMILELERKDLEDRWMTEILRK